MPTELRATPHYGVPASSVPLPVPPDSLHPLPHVVSTRTAETTVLMDRKLGNYHTLNEVGGRVWELICAGNTTLTIVSRLLGEYDVPRLELEGDVARVVEELLALGLIAPGPQTALTAPAHQEVARTIQSHEDGVDKVWLPSVLWCGLAILTVKVALRTRGFDWAIAWIQRRVKDVAATACLDTETVRAAERSVAIAGALYPGRARCLEQSLVLYSLLRRQGIAVKYCQGVQAHPFVAHAWVEYRDEPVNDVIEHVQLYAPLPSPLP
jgi:hypothetical protein